MLRIGLMGTGRAGRNHVAAYQKLEDAQLHMVTDVSAESARQAAARCGAQAVASPEDILRSPDIDVVDICVPTFLHREYVTKAAEAGKHVICEKPVALTVEDGQAMIDACREAGVRFFVAHPTRFLPDTRRIKSLLDSGAFGRPLLAKTRRGGRFFPGVNGWIDDVSKSGSILVEAMLHDFDALRWYFGPVEDVYCAWQVSEEPCHLEAAFATLRFRNGVIAMVEGNRIHNDRFYNTAEISCTGGVLTFDRRNMAPLRVTMAAFDGNAVSLSTSHASPDEFDQFEAELDHFISCIESGQPAITTPEDAVASLAIALAAVRSHQSGTVIKL
jgi:UDP-N-acetylglucosamine 3-dehydrogenase